MELDLKQNVWVCWGESHRTVRSLCLRKSRLVTQTVLFSIVSELFYSHSLLRFFLEQRRHWMQISSEGKPWEFWPGVGIWATYFPTWPMQTRACQVSGVLTETTWWPLGRENQGSIWEGELESLKEENKEILNLKYCIKAVKEKVVFLTWGVLSMIASFLILKILLPGDRELMQVSFQKTTYYHESVSYENSEDRNPTVASLGQEAGKALTGPVFSGARVWLVWGPLDLGSGVPPELYFTSPFLSMLASNFCYFFTQQ